MMRSIRLYFHLITLSIFLTGCESSSPTLDNGNIKLSWKRSNDGWKIEELKIKEGANWKDVGTPSGEYTLLFSPAKPDSTVTSFMTNTGLRFPEPIYRYQQDFFKLSTQPVAMNTAGEAYHFYPQEFSTSGNEIVFEFENELAFISSTWKADSAFNSDIVVEQKLVARKDGYYSLASSTLFITADKDIAWATVPGYFQGNAIQPDSVLAYAYGHGIPSFPALYRERAMSTLTSIVDSKNGVSFSVTPSPGLGRDPWANDQMTHEDWKLGISHKNRKNELSPTLYYPVLGEPTSLLKAGDTIRYSFRFSITNGSWFKSLHHTVDDIYKFKKSLALRTNKQSLTSRVEAMHHYLMNAKTSMWNIESYQGLKIGGQSYQGGVVGSQGDAMKNADYGAMWMLAKATGDEKLKREVLPYALNFKLTQQQTTPGFFQGAAVGQYYLRKSKKFVEEWGEFIEPISLTYYTMLDVGNMLLFEPENKILRDRLRLGADLLLKWQKTDGSWEVAYDEKSEQPLFKDIQDLRPTFYGLLVAYRILKDEKYLTAARKGADWLIKEGVEKGHFIGVCGDARYAPDFATAQTAQTLLDMYDFTNDKNYMEAAVKAAEIYTTSIFTHPVPSQKIKTVRGTERQDWEISQAGLSFEHGGIMGSAQRHGPILLASHAGMFVRMFRITGDSLFINMARAAAIGRDAFVDPATKVASYYWSAMTNGAGPYPHHAWWQIGWITDYIMAEAQLRSEGNVMFERGFVAPKVGPHQTYGFTPGSIFGKKANLIIREGLVICDDPNIERITALSTDAKYLYVVLLSDVAAPLKINFSIEPDKIIKGLKIKSITEEIAHENLELVSSHAASLLPYGIKVYSIAFD